MATNLPSCFSIQFSEQLLKFLVNFTLLKYVKSQRSYGFLITKELIFGFQILDLKDHFLASLKCFRVQRSKFQEVCRCQLSSLRDSNCYVFYKYFRCVTLKNTIILAGINYPMNLVKLAEVRKIRLCNTKICDFQMTRQK